MANLKALAGLLGKLKRVDAARSISPGSLKAKWAFRGSIRARFYRHVIGQNSNGVPLTTCIETYRDRQERRRQHATADVLTSVLSAMHNGFTLDKALQPWVPSDEYGVIVGGVVANALPTALSRLLKVKERTRTVRRAILSALAAPAGNFAVAFGFMYFMGEGVLPVFEGLVPKARADALVRSLYDMGAFATGWGLPAMLLAIAAIIAIVVWSLPRWTGTLRIFAEKAFPWSFYRDMQGYLWLMGYSSLLAAGTPEIGALGTQLTAATPWLAEKLRAISYHMKGGLKLPAALRQAAPGVSDDTEEERMPHSFSAVPFNFPSLDIIEDIESLHGFADFPDRIERVADQWSEDIMERTKMVAKVLGLVGSLLTYAVIIFIILGCNDLQAGLSATASSVTH